MGGGLQIEQGGREGKMPQFWHLHPDQMSRDFRASSNTSRHYEITKRHTLGNHKFVL